MNPNINIGGLFILAIFGFVIVGICVFAVKKFSTTYEESGFSQYVLKPKTLFERSVSCLGALSALIFLWGFAMLVGYLLFLFALG